MKATINGITVEGTPQEIMEFHRMQNEKMWINPSPYTPSTKPDYQYFIKPMITTTKKCPNIGMACNCTGECR